MVEQLKMESLINGPPSSQDGGHALRRWMRQMRDEHPIWTDSQGIHHVFRYAEVQQVMIDYETFSSDRTKLLPPSRQLGKGNLTIMDPPEHRKIRQLVSRAFTPRMIATLERRIVELADDLLDKVDSEEFDLLQCLAYPLPVIVIAELLGVPTADRELFRSWSVGLERDEVATVQEMNVYLLARTREARSAPQGDLISQLINAEIDGERLDDDEIASLSGLLLLGGYITTTVLIGNAILCLQENPDAAAELRVDPALIPAAIEEVLRYRPSFTQITRISTADSNLGGYLIPRGKLVINWLLSANHDERIFADPDQFDIHRRPNKQAAFGHGMHFCLGAPLARLEGRIALEQLLKRFPDLRIAPGAELSYHNHPTCALKHLPVVTRP